MTMVMRGLWAVMLACAGLVALAQPELVPTQPNVADNVPALVRQLGDADAGVRTQAAQRLVGFADQRALDPLIAALQDPNEQVRTMVVAALGSYRDAKALTAVLGALRDKALMVRLRAAQVLAQRDTPQVVAPLLEALHAEEWEMRQAAAEALGYLHDARAADPLLALLTDPQPEVRLAAALAMGRLRDPRAFDLLVELLKVADYGTRAAAANGLGELRDVRAVEPLVAALRDTKIGAQYEVLSAISMLAEANNGAPALRQAVPTLIEKLTDSNLGVQAYAATVLGQIRDVRAVEGLIGLLQHKDIWVRQRAVTALGQIDDPRATEALLGALKEPNLREEALRACWSGPPERQDRLLAALHALLGSTDKETRQFALRNLADTGDPATVPALVKAIADEDPSLRVAAIEAVRAFRDPRALAPLQAALQDPTDEVRQAAVGALEQVRDPRLLEMALGLLAAETPEKRVMGVRLLRRDWSPRAVQALLEALRDPEANVRQAAIGVLQRYSTNVSDARFLDPAGALLTSKDAPVRCLGATVLGWTRDVRAYPPLVIAAADPDAEVRAAALRALGALQRLPFTSRTRPRQQQTKELLLAAMKDKVPAVRQAALPGLADYLADPRVLEVFCAATRETDNDIRSTAVTTLASSRLLRGEAAVLAAFPQLDPQTQRNYLWSLGQLSDPKAYDLLVQLVRNPDRNLGREALQALMRGNDPRGVTFVCTLLRETAPGRDLTPLTWEKNLRSTGWYTYWGGGDNELAGAAFGVLELAGTPAVAPVLALLKDEHVEVRVVAIAGLGRLRDARALEPLIGLLRGGGELERRAAAVVLGSMEDIRAVAPLIAALDTPDKVTRINAARSLGVIGDRRGTERLLRLLQAKDADEQFIAAFALGKLKDPRAVTPLQAVLVAHPDPGVRAQAAWALGEIGDRQALEPLLQAFTTDASADVRGNVAEALGKIADPRGAEALLAAFQQMPRLPARSRSRFFFKGGDDIFTLRGRILLALARQGDPRVLESLLTIVKQEDEGYSADDAVMALEKYRDPRIVEALVAAVQEGGRYNYTAQHLLAKIGPPAVAPLLRLLDSEDVGIRQQAGNVLQRIFVAEKQADPAVKETLWALLHNAQAKRTNAAQLLTLAGDARAADYLVEVLRDTTNPAYEWALSTLAALTDPRAVAYLAPALTAPEATTSQRASTLYTLYTLAQTHPRAPELAQVVPVLVSLLKQVTPYQRTYLIGTLARTDDPRARTALLAVLQDKEAGTRLEAALALGHQGDPRAEAVLIPLLQDLTCTRRADVAAALGHYHSPRAIAALSAALRDPAYYASYPLNNRNSVREQAALALAAIGDTRAVPALIDALDFGWLRGRQAAAEALVTLTGQDHGLDSAAWRAWWQARGK